VTWGIYSNERITGVFTSTLSSVVETLIVSLEPGIRFLTPVVIEDPMFAMFEIATGTILKIKITSTMNNMIPPVIKRILAIRFAFVEFSDITLILYKIKCVLSIV
jgi:hypothetical protein